MHTILRRIVAASLAAALLVGVLAAPVAAVDPSTAPPASPEPDVPATSPITVHAEMLGAHAGDPSTFTPGAAPAPLGGRAPLGGVSTQGGTAGGGLPSGLKAEVFGYLPHWSLSSSKLQHLDYELLSTIAYFGVPATRDGTLQKSGVYWDGWTSSHMTDVITRAHARGAKVVLTVTMMAWSSSADMTALLTSASNRARLAGEIAGAVAGRNADGVNLDFEPVPNSLQASYTAFVREVRAALGADAWLTVATTGGAASWDEGYDLPALVAPGAADALMVMGYDYSWSGSAYAGGVSPMSNPHILDVGEAMDDYLAAVPASKLIWGVPYYGRAWTTVTADQNSRTCRSAGSCGSASWAFTYTDALSSVASHGRRWDATGRVPWYRHQSSTYGTWVQGYYDDAASLQAKYDRVRASGMRGVGIWHLLMDAGRRELWTELQQNFARLPFSDIASSPFWQEITWLFEQGISGGCGDGRFCPSAYVTRGEMASFLARALDLPAASRDWFTDDASSVHQDAINRLADAGVTVGCSPGRFCPGGTVRRDEMASFLARALDLPTATRDHFTDDATNVHQGNINRLADAKIAGGCAAGRYCPTASVTREQMAAFLYRALKS